MAKNKAAKISSEGTYLYKNSRYKEISSSELPTRGNIEQYIYIPLMSNIRDGVLSKMSTVTANGKTCYRIQESVNDSSILDFGDNRITFMNCNPQQGDKFLGCFPPTTNSYTSGLESNIDLNGYGAAFPMLKGYPQQGRPNVSYSNFSLFFSDWSLNEAGVPISFANKHRPYDAARKHYVGENLLNLSAQYDGGNDCFLIPEVRSASPMYEKDGGYNDMFYPDLICHLGYNVSKDGVGTFGLTPDDPEYLDSDVYSGYQIGGGSISDPNANNGSCFMRMTAYGRSSGRFLFRKNDVEKIVFELNHRNIRYSEIYSMISYAFIYDDDNDDVCVLFSCFNANNQVETYIAPINALNKAVATPLQSASLDFDMNDFIKSILGDMIDEDKVPVPPNFDDGGPGITGGGDPYGDYDNVDGVVGGDSDTTKDLNSVDSTPNTSFDQFMQNTGYFGSYVLSYDDLKRYTKTLGELYSHSNDILFGEACQAKADRINSSVTGLHILPISIPSTDYASTVFSMGNTGIMGDGTWAQYIAGNNWANANYLKRLTRQFTVELGEIKHNYDNFLDFAPYSTASLFIPYVGKVEIPINLIQSTDTDHRPLKLDFRVDYTTGDFIVILFANINGVDVNISHWNGNCAKPVKISVYDDSNAIREGADRIVSMFSASMSMGGTNKSISTGSTSSNMETRNGYYTNETKNTSDTYNYNAGNNSGGITVRTPSMPTSVTSGQHMIGNGASTGFLGYLSVQKIVLVVERPVWWKPYEYGKYMGYPTKKIAKLSSITGFAKVTDIHVRSFATAAEKDELTAILSEGVLF